MKNGGDGDLEENTFKQYYFPVSNDDNSLPAYQHKRNNDSIEEFFDAAEKKKLKRSPHRSVREPKNSSIAGNEGDFNESNDVINS